MGFDNECIVNIQSLAGEYFCPVCRLLVYPNEALQSLCTHLYCKPCLTYIVSTTKACPYDGYLVTEADSKLLIESNKPLAETIGKITVHCLYHRSGCTWQGPLSDCTHHCSGCAFGNSPVVCNRCGIQIIHRQVQEHAQNCPGVQPQAQHSEGVQDSAATGTAATGDKGQAPTQAGVTTSQPPTSQMAASSTPGQYPNQQANSTTQAQAAAPTAEQWYQQQQQYQQYYQQYPGYDPYHQHYQHYYPYQQQSVSQYQQSQVYVQPQPPQTKLQAPMQVQPHAQLQNQSQSQSQSHQPAQLPVAAQPQNQVQVNLQQQNQSSIQPQSIPAVQTHPPTHGHPHPQVQPQTPTYPVQPHHQTHGHPHVQMPQHQQPHFQVQHPQALVLAQPHSQFHSQHNPVPQSHSQAQPPAKVQHHPQPLPQAVMAQPTQPVNQTLQPQTQHPSVHGVTGHHSYPQLPSHQQMPLGTPHQSIHMHPQGGPQPQSQHPIQVQSQFAQQPPLLGHPQTHPTIQNPQQQGLLPSPMQMSGLPPQQPMHSHVHQHGLPVHQHPLALSVPQPMQNQQLFSGQARGPIQQGPYVQSQLHSQAPSQSFPLPSHAYQQPQQSVALQHISQPHQAQSLAARVSGGPVQPYPHSTLGMQVGPMEGGPDQKSGNISKTNNQVHLPSEKQSEVTSRPTPEKQDDGLIGNGAEAEPSFQKIAKKVPNDLGMDSGLGSDAGEVKTIKSEIDLNPVDHENKPLGEAKDKSELHATENGEPFVKQVKEEPTEGSDNHRSISNVYPEQVELSVLEDKKLKDGPLLKEAESLEEQRFESPKDKNLIHQGTRGIPPHNHVQAEGGLLQSTLVPAFDQGKQQPFKLHNEPSGVQQRPAGSSLSQAPASGPPHHAQLPGHLLSQIRPAGSDHVPHIGQPLNLPSDHLQQPVHNQMHGPEISPGGIPGPCSASVFGRGPGHFGPAQGPYIDGRQQDPLVRHFGMHSGPDSLSRDNRLPDEHFNPQDPSQLITEDLKQFPRPSHSNAESFTKLGGHFSSSRSLDRGPHSVGMDMAPRPIDKGPHGLNYDSAVGGSAPSRFFSPYNRDGPLHPIEGDRPVGFYDNNLARLDSSRSHPDFFAPVAGYGQRRMDGLAPSPGRDFPPISSGGFSILSGLDDVDGRDSRHFRGHISSSFRESRFPVFPSHLRRGEFEGPGNFGMDDHRRIGDFIGQDGLPSHLQRGESWGPPNLPSHMRFGEPNSFGGFPARMGELGGPGNLYRPRLGEPGFRSSFSQKGFPIDGGNYAGDFEFDNSRKRKLSSMGWCRICKIDCESVEGLDLHSQTKEHQKMAMEMVATIKKNAKKMKLVPGGHFSPDDASKSRNVNFESRGNKH